MGWNWPSRQKEFKIKWNIHSFNFVWCMLAESEAQ